MNETQPPEGEQRGAGVHRALPARGEPQVDPGARGTQRELEVERSVDDDGQYEQHGGEGRQVVGAERVRAERAPEPRVQQAGQRRAGGEVCGVAEPGARRQAPKQQVAGQQGERRQERREGPAPVEQGVRDHAKDIGGEAVAGEGDAVAARERAHDGERQQLRCEPRPRPGSAGPVYKRRPANRDDGPEPDERAREQGRRRLDAREGTHAARASSGVWRGVSSATKLQRMRVTIEYCVV